MVNRCGDDDRNVPHEEFDRRLCGAVEEVVANEGLSQRTEPDKSRLH